MPPILVFVWIIVGGASTALLGPPRAWDPLDPTERSKLGWPVEVSYNLTTSAPWVQVAATNAKGDEMCPVTVIATVTGPCVRLQLDGVEQNVDNGWMVDVEVPAGMQYTAKAEFLDPIGGKTLAVRTATVKCVRQTVEPARDQVLYDAQGLRGYEPKCVCPGEETR